MGRIWQGMVASAITAALAAGCSSTPEVRFSSMPERTLDASEAVEAALAAMRDTAAAYGATVADDATCWLVDTASDGAGAVVANGDALCGPVAFPAWEPRTDDRWVEVVLEFHGPEDGDFVVVRDAWAADAAVVVDDTQKLYHPDGLDIADFADTPLTTPIFPDPDPLDPGESVSVTSADLDRLGIGDLSGPTVPLTTVTLTGVAGTLQIAAGPVGERAGERDRAIIAPDGYQLVLIQTRYRPADDATYDRPVDVVTFAAPDREPVELDDGFRLVVVPDDGRPATVALTTDGVKQTVTVDHTGTVEVDVPPQAEALYFDHYTDTDAPKLGEIVLREETGPLYYQSGWVIEDIQVFRLTTTGWLPDHYWATPGTVWVTAELYGMFNVPASGCLNFRFSSDTLLLDGAPAAYYSGGYFGGYVDVAGWFYTFAADVTADSWDLTFQPTVEWVPDEATTCTAGETRYADADATLSYPAPDRTGAPAPAS